MARSLQHLRAAPAEARRQLGADLFRVQCGQSPRDFNRVRGFGEGVHEVRVHAGVEYRLAYVSEFPEAVYVLHVFAKKSRRTAMRDLRVIRANYGLVERQRSQGG